MGKNLKGKEIGKGICQRKDGLFVARLVEKSGKRHANIFKTIPEARNWLEDTRQADRHDTHLYKLCDGACIERFCMHALRHTYATRAIERGVPPKVLQKLLGHASIKTTMGRYVHVTDDSMKSAIRLFESGENGI